MLVIHNHKSLFLKKEVLFLKALLRPFSFIYHWRFIREAFFEKYYLLPPTRPLDVHFKLVTCKLIYY